MTTLLAYVFGLLLVGGLLFLVASFAFGRDEEMVPALPEGTPLELPDDRPADGRDLRDLRLSVVARGYRMDEVDWLLDRLAEQVDARDREIARLRSVLHVEPVPTDPRDETDWSHPDPPPGGDREAHADRLPGGDREAHADRLPGGDREPEVRPAVHTDRLPGGDPEPGGDSERAGWPSEAPAEVAAERGERPAGER